LAVVIGGALGASPNVTATPSHRHGTAKLDVPGPGRHGQPGALHAVAGVHSTFELPAGAWTNGVYPNLGFSQSIVGGPYWRAVTAGSGTRCELALNTTARSAGAKPQLGFRPTARGYASALQWFSGTATLAGLGPATIAKAFMPTPAGFAPARDRWTEFELDLTASPASPTCEHARSIVSVRRAIQTERLVRAG
jgi:hypothetical protein